MPKAKISLCLDPDLAAFVKDFAAQRHATVTDVITQYPLALKRNAEGESGGTILADPDLRRAMEEARARLQDGTATWSSYDEVFSD